MLVLSKQWKGRTVLRPDCGRARIIAASQSRFDRYRPATGLRGAAENTVELQQCFLFSADLLQNTASFSFVLFCQFNEDRADDRVYSLRFF